MPGSQSSRFAALSPKEESPKRGHHVCHLWSPHCGSIVDPKPQQYPMTLRDIRACTQCPCKKKKTKGPLCSQVVHNNALSAIAKKLVQSHHVLCSVLTTRRGDKELGEDARAAAEAAFAQFFPHFLFFQHCDLGFQELSATQGLPSNSWHSEPFAAMRFAEKPIF